MPSKLRDTVVTFFDEKKSLFFIIRQTRFEKDFAKPVFKIWCLSLPIPVFLNHFKSRNPRNVNIHLP